MRFNDSDIKGIVVPMISPMDNQGNLDENALCRLVDYFLQGGVHGIFVNSTTGEGLCLADAEKEKALDLVMAQVNGRVPVYAGVSDTSTKRALQNLAQVQKAGADIAVAHAPFYFPPNSQQELYDYFHELAQAAAIPLMLYNIPFTTKASISLETVRRLAQVENIVGIKDSSVDWVYLMNLIELKRKERPNFRIFIGKTHMWTAGILSGADGGLDGISNLAPAHCVRLYKAILSGSADVYEKQREINEIWRVYECTSFLGGIKAALQMMDLCQPYAGHPILPASEAERAKIAIILKNYQLLA